MVCLSSGEPELMALVGGAFEGIATRARTREPDTWCDSSLLYAGVDNLWPCKGARETRAQ